MLYLAALLLVLAMYTKISTAFLAPVFALVLLRDRGWAILKDRHIYIVTLLAIVGLVPLLVLTLKFGQANVQSVTGIADATVSRSSLAGWVWYMRQIPSQIGWTAAVAAIVGAAALILPRYRSAAGLSQADLLFWGLWFAIGYLFFSSIDLKETRHSVFILVPVIFAAMLALDRLHHVHDREFQQSAQRHRGFEYPARIDRVGPADAGDVGDPVGDSRGDSCIQQGGIERVGKRGRGRARHNEPDLFMRHAAPQACCAERASSRNSP